MEIHKLSNPPAWWKTGAHTVDTPGCFHEFCGSLCWKCGFSSYLKQIQDNEEKLDKNSK